LIVIPTFLTALSKLLRPEALTPTNALGLLSSCSQHLSQPTFVRGRRCGWRRPRERSNAAGNGYIFIARQHLYRREMYLFVKLKSLVIK